MTRHPTKAVTLADKDNPTPVLCELNEPVAKPFSLYETCAFDNLRLEIAKPFNGFES